MAINVILSESKTQKEKPFPKLMRQKYTNMIFYFHRSELGLPLNAPHYTNDYKEWAASWDMDFFEDYNGPITIQNA